MFEKISNLKKEKINVKILLHGDSGSGKTYSASGSPKPLILLTEKNGLISIESSNPDAVVAVCTTAQQVRDVFQEIIKNGIKAHGCDTLVIDSLTEIQHLFKDDILEKSKKRLFSLQNWGELTEVMRKFMRMIRNLDMDVVCTCLCQYNPEEEVTRITPQFEGKSTPQEVSQYFNAVGFVFRSATKSAKGETTHSHKIMFEGPARVTCKPCGSLKGVVDADINEIFKQIRGE